jgi:competence ComEA-like helix-hairpin-helix protein
MESPSPPTPSRQGRGSSSEGPHQTASKLPYFSRSQLGVMLLLAAALLLLYGWRAHWLGVPSPARLGIRHLTFVEVTGPVAHPGVYSFPQAPRLGEIWQQAGAPGAAPDKDKKIASGSRVEVTAGGGYHLASMSGAQLLTLGLPIDLNRASAEDLEAVPGIGPVLARRIVAYRQAHGAFKSVDELGEKVSGFGAKKVAKIKPYLFIQ